MYKQKSIESENDQINDASWVVQSWVNRMKASFPMIYYTYQNLRKFRLKITICPTEEKKGVNGGNIEQSLSSC